jgi:hypothetical protein
MPLIFDTLTWCVMFAQATQGWRFIEAEFFWQTNLEHWAIDPTEIEWEPGAEVLWSPPFSPALIGELGS